MSRRFWTDTLLLAIAAALLFFCLQTVDFAVAAFRANDFLQHYWLLLAGGVAVILVCGFSLRVPLR